MAQTNARVGSAIQKEGSFINKSLMFLGVIISRLSEGDKLAHLPFRDSKVSGRDTGARRQRDTLMSAQGALVAAMRIR